MNLKMKRGSFLVMTIIPSKKEKRSFHFKFHWTICCRTKIQIGKLTCTVPTTHIENFIIDFPKIILSYLLEVFRTTIIKLRIEEETHSSKGDDSPVSAV